MFESVERNIQENIYWSSIHNPVWSYDYVMGQMLLNNQ